jgi:hypothetical protein
VLFVSSYLRGEIGGGGWRGFVALCGLRGSVVYLGEGRLTP